jgi:dolichol-phosphate mannosyltransferase
MSHDALIVIPTYNECDNVRPIAAAVFRHLPEAHILFVDDNSPDGTGSILDEMARADARVKVQHRAAKDGLGRAYISGFQQALREGYQHIFEMDADFSHDPATLPRFLEAAREADLVLGSRYIDGIRIINWPLSRLILSKGAALYVRIVTGMPISDPTGGFKCFRRAALEAIDLQAIVSNGYSFQVEMTHALWLAGFRIREIPIVFEDRRAGHSKMSRDIVRECLWIVWRLALRCGFRRKPRSRALPPPAPPDTPAP